MVFLWLVVRSIHAGHGRLMLWLGWFLVGLAVVLSSRPDLSAAGRIAVNVWAWGVILLPAWWAVQAVRRAGRVQR